MLLGQFQKLANGVRFPLDRPSPRNVERLDMSALPLIDRMHRNGIYLNTDKCKELDSKIIVERDRIAGDIEYLAGRIINPGSPKQVSQLLYKEMRLDTAYKDKYGKKLGETSSGLLSTNDENLTQLKQFSPLPELILDWRELDKITGTYSGKLWKMINPYTDRLHTTFNPVRTATGRLASVNPNLMNIPTRSMWGQLVRYCFEAMGAKRGGRWIETVLVSGDLSQIEMVLAAYMSKDPNMCRVFLDKLDLHTFTALSMFRLSADDVEPDPEKYPGAVCTHPSGKWPISWKEFKKKYRLPAKQIGFGILYGTTAEGLQQQILNEGGPYWTVEACAALISEWYRVYYKVYEWTCEQHARVFRWNMVWDPFGRWRLIPQGLSKVKGIVSDGLREASNMPIQSAAQGVIKLAMAELEHVVRYYERLGEVCMPLLQIHDELIFEVSRTIAEEFGYKMSKIMRGVVQLDNVPLGSSCDTAMSWGALK